MAASCVCATTADVHVGLLSHFPPMCYEYGPVHVDTTADEPDDRDMKPLRYTVRNLSLGGSDVWPTDQLTVGELANAVLVLAYYDEVQHPERTPSVCIACLQMAVGEMKCPHGTFPEDRRSAPVLLWPEDLSDHVTSSVGQQREGTPESDLQNSALNNRFLSTNRAAIFASLPSPHTNRSDFARQPLPSATTRSPQGLRHPARTFEIYESHSLPTQSPSNFKFAPMINLPYETRHVGQAGLPIWRAGLLSDSRAQATTSRSAGVPATPPLPSPPPPTSTTLRDINTYNIHIPPNDPTHRGQWYVVTRGLRVGVFPNIVDVMRATFTVTDASWLRTRTYASATETFWRVAATGGVTILQC